MEIVSPSPLAAVVAMFCMLTILINLSVCYYIYCKRSLRSCCTSLIVANLAAVDVLVSIKDLPILISVSTSGRWYFEEQWCRLYGLTNVIYIVVAVSTLVTITSERYFRSTEAVGPRSGSYQGRSMPLGYIIAHTTLSYSLSLMWSKYVFISRKAFCQIDWPPSGLPYTLATSAFFLVPVTMLIYNFFGREKEEEIARKLRAATAENISELEQGEKLSLEKQKSQGHLQTAITVFLVTWSPYVVESFFTRSSQVPNVVGVVCACIPIMTTTLIPLWYIKWRRDLELSKPFALPAENC